MSRYRQGSRGRPEHTARLVVRHNETGGTGRRLDERRNSER